MTVFRKYGTYLPEPSRVGGFEVDIIARYKNDYAIGVTLNENDFNSGNLIDKLNYLATRHTKYTNKKVMLFLGVPAAYYKQAKLILEQLQPDARKNIKLFQIIDRRLKINKEDMLDKNVLFS
ncbi:hypothetical protein BMS3Abin03_00460 [bacterium BMS3Abin03]|nr:hypothetical protein BMS3Abin03_00460 [bacterium BMS3Abin03]